MNNKFTVKNGKELRCGYTTGTCATAAIVSAVRCLLTGEKFERVSLTLPNGETHSINVAETVILEDWVSCCVIKDSGDDPDITDGIKIFAQVKLTPVGITIKAGTGIGTVTAKGLKIPIGEPAINPVPRKQILQNIESVFREFDYTGGAEIILSAPEGVEIAKRTFNPRLGIMGGISVLGTTGIVEPMSEAALIDTIKLMTDRQFSQNPEKIIITPGNYGRDFAKNALNIDLDKAVKFSNFLGETLDYIKYLGFKQVLLIAHVGKLVKVAGGIMNTHSSMADCRMEIVAAHAGMLGASTDLITQIMNCTTTDALLELLEENPIDNLWESIGKKISFYIEKRLENTKAEIVMFGGNGKILYTDSI